MKVVFVNPPVIRSKNSSPENDFKIEGFVFHPCLWHIKGMSRILKFFHRYFGLGRSVKYGIRAGSRWPFTMDLPMTYFPYPFIMGYATSYFKKNCFDVSGGNRFSRYDFGNYIKKIDLVKFKAKIVKIIASDNELFPYDLSLKSQIFIG